PAAYHSVSPTTQAANATANSALSDSLPCAARAPATTSVGTAGSGRPTCSSSTLTKTSASPYCATRRTISVKSAPELALAPLEELVVHADAEQVGGDLHLLRNAEHDVLL